MVETIMIPVSWPHSYPNDAIEKEAELGHTQLNIALKQGFNLVTSHVISAAGRQFVVIIVHKPDED